MHWMILYIHINIWSQNRSKSWVKRFTTEGCYQGITVHDFFWNSFFEFLSRSLLSNHLLFLANDCRSSTIVNPFGRPHMYEFRLRWCHQLLFFNVNFSHFELWLEVRNSRNFKLIIANFSFHTTARSETKWWYEMRKSIQLKPINYLSISQYINQFNLFFFILGTIKTRQFLNL